MRFSAPAEQLGVEEDCAAHSVLDTVGACSKVLLMPTSSRSVGVTRPSGSRRYRRESTGPNRLRGRMMSLHVDSDVGGCINNPVRHGPADCVLAATLRVTWHLSSSTRSPRSICACGDIDSGDVAALGGVIDRHWTLRSFSPTPMRRRHSEVPGDNSAPLGRKAFPLHRTTAGAPSFTRGACS